MKFNDRIRAFILFVGILLTSSQVFGQVTIYSENFDSYPDGTLTGVNWDATLFNNCDEPNTGNGTNFDWGVFSGAFQISDVEGFNCCDLNGNPNPAEQFGDSGNTLTIGPISIAGYAGVSIDFDFTPSGNMECSFTDFAPIEPCPGANATPFCQGGHDQAIFSYSVDGAPAVVFGYYCGDMFCYGEDFVCGTIVGNNLEIIVQAGTQADSESYSLDNFVVQGYLTPFAQADAVTMDICAGEDINLLETAGFANAWTWSGPSFSSNLQNPTITNATVANSGTYTVDITDPNGCVASSSVTINVNPATTPSLTPVGPLCDNDPPVALNTTQSGITGVWSGFGVTGNSFDPSSGSSSLVFTPDAGQCANTPPPISVLVNSAVTPTLGTYGPFCENDGSISLPANPSGITGTWGGDGVTGTTFDPGSAGAGNANVTFTPSAGECANTPAPISITVNGAVTPDLGSYGPFCENDGSISLPANPSGITGTWGGDGVTGTTFDPGSAGAGSANVTFTPSAGECANTPAPISITVNGAVTPDLGSYGPFCENDGSISLPANPSGIAGTWGGDGVTGTTFDPGSAGVGNANVTFTPSAGECANTPAPISIAVTASITPMITGLNPNVCADDPNVNLGLSYSGISGSWTGATVISNQFVTSMATAGPNTVTFVPDAGQCATSVTFTFTVTPSTTLTINDPGTPFCNDDGAINLTTNPGGISGGWSGTGVTGNIFNPSSANTGGNLVTFTPNAGQCATSDDIVLVVDPTPTAGNAGPLTTCADQTGMGSFDLTSLENTINGDPSVSINWTEDIAGTTPIVDPANYMSGATTVFASVTLGNCSSIPVAIQLNLDSQPNIVASSFSACEDASGQATFDLTDNGITSAINGGNGFAVSYFSDAAGTNPLSNPNAYVISTSPSSVFAFVEDPVTMCLSEAALITLNILPDPVVVDPNDLDECDQGGGQALFDLSVLNGTVDPTGINTVTWYTDPAGTNPIANPSSFNTSDITVYAAVADGVCTSTTVAVNLNVTPTPTINPTDPNPVCDNGFGQGTFDLSILENTINGGSSEPVNWYEDAGQSTPIFNTTNYVGSGVIFVTVGTGNCLSGPEAINLSLLSGPIGNDISDEICGDVSGQATIDLTNYDLQINSDPSNTITWYSDPAGTNVIPNPTAFVTGSTIVYAEVFDGNCTSATLAQFTITVNAAPQAFPPSQPLTACIIFPFDATVNLTLVEDDINGNTGFTVNWYVDQAATIPINDPSDFNFNIPTSVWATVTDPSTGCETPTTVEVPLALAFAPTANNPGTQTACDDGTGSATFDLTSLNGIIGGANMVTYYTDPGLTNEILNPGSYVSSGGTIYAVVSDGVCESAEEAFNLQILPAPTANSVPGPNDFCEDVTNSAIVDLTLYNSIVLGGQSGSVTWFEDPSGLSQIFPDNAYTINGFTTVYAQVNDGTCPSSLVAVDLNLLMAPDAFSAQLSDCPDITGFATFDLTDFALQNQINGGTGNNIDFYFDPGATSLVTNPDAFVTDMNIILFAVVTDANGCTSVAVPIDLMLENTPIANSTSIELCDEGGGQATFNLDDPLLQTIINGNTGLPINWYQDAVGNTPLSNTGAFVSSSTQVFVTVVGTSCESVPVPIDLIVSPTPSINTPMNDLELCDEGGGQATFNLNTLNTTINGGNGFAVNWFFDASAMNPIPDPANFLSGSTTVFANTVDGICTSDMTVPVNVVVLDPPIANEVTLELCDEGANRATFDLTDPNTVDMITGGATGVTLSWYEDIGLTMPIADPSSYFTPPTVVYVVVSNGACDSAPTEITLDVIPAPVVLPIGPLIACDQGNGMATIDLTQYDNNVNAGQGFMVNWYTDNNGNNLIVDPTNYTAMDGSAVFASVTNSTTGCESPTVTIVIDVPSPVDGMIGLVQAVSCASFNDGAIDLMVSGGTDPYSYDWNDDNYDGVEDPTNLSAGTYQVTITDDAGCVGTALIILTEPDELLISCSEFAPVTMVGGADGIAEIDIIGGTAPYQLTYNGPSSGSTNANTDGTIQINDLAAGNYTLTIVDNNGCTTDCSFTINDPSCDLSLEIAGMNISCNGAMDGSIDLTITGGSGNYTIDWNDDNLDGIEDPSSLSAGNYTVIVTDDQSCQSTISITITEPNVIDLVCSESTPVSTVGGNDGVGEVVITGGTPPYSIDYAGPLSGTVNSAMEGSVEISDLEEGTYNITVTDDNGCQSTCSFEIMGPSCTMSLDIVGMDISCFGESDGTVDLTINNGTAPFIIDWSNDAFDGQEDLIDLAPGILNVTVTDAIGCTADTMITISEPAELTIVCAEDTPVSVLGGMDGVASVNITGGTAPFDISYTGPETGSVTAMMEGTALINNLSAGDYNITVTDANGCMTTCMVTITDPSCNLTLSFSGTLISCFGANDGAIDLTISNGTEPFTIDWSDDSFDGQEDIMGVGPGTISVTVTDAAGCSASTSITLTEPTELIIDCAEDAAVSTIGGMDGVASVNIMGGTASYNISYSGPESGTIMAMNEGVVLIPNLPAGTYEITVTDINTCVMTCTVVITDPSCNMTLDISGMDISCFGASDGTVDLTINNGTAPFTIDWSDDDFDGQEDLTGVGPGTLTVMVTDAAGCTADTMITISEPAELTLACAEEMAVSTVGGMDGIISVTIGGGTAPYDISYMGPENGTEVAMMEGTIQIPNLSAGTYTITVSDANDCEMTCSVTVTDPACSMSLDISGMDISCFGASDGTVDLTINNGTEPFTIDWSNDIFDGQEDLMGVGPGTLTVMVTDAAGCIANTMITIEEPAELTLVCAEEMAVSSVGGMDGIASVTISGGTPDYDIAFTGPMTGSITTMMEGVVQLPNLLAGSYTITVTDANGCEQTCNVTITDPACSMTLDISGMDISCFGASDGTVDLTINNGTAPFTIDWSDDSFDGQEDLMGVGPGTLTVTVTDAAACTASTMITINEPAELTLDCSEEMPVGTIGGMDGIGAIIITGGTAPYDVSYAGPVIGNTIAMTAGITQITNLPAGDYNIVVSDANDCESTCIITITEPVCNMSLDINGMDISCFGASDGNVDLSINNGTAPFTIDWSDDIYDGQEDLMGVGPGTLTVTVTDAVGCIADTMITITEPAELTLVCAEDMPVSTVGGMDGIGAVTISGGTAPFDIAYAGPETGNVIAMMDGTTQIPSLSAGDYNIIVTDANDCEANCMITITEPVCNMTLDIVGTEISCFGEDDGTVDLTINNGTAPFTIDWSDDIYDGQEDLMGVGPGLLEVTVTDAVGCVASTMITFIEPEELQIACSEFSGVSIVGGTDGVGAIVISGGTSAYNISYDGPVSGNQMTDNEGQVLIENLPAGVYNITVTDDNACESTCTIEITEPSCIMSLQLDVSNVTCNGDMDGTISLSIFDGTGPFDIDWSDDSFDGMQFLQNLGPGAYAVTVTDASGCIAMIDTIVTEPDVLVLDCAQESPATTVGGDDGAAAISFGGGTAPYTLTYDGGEFGIVNEDQAGNIIIPDLMPGDYTLVLEDANGCAVECNFIIEEPDCNLTLEIDGSNISCFGANDGSIDVTVNNGTAPFIFDWTDDSLDGIEDPSGLAAGIYSVKVTDVFGCTESINIEITEPEMISFNCNVENNVSTEGGDDGLASITVSGGTPPFSATYSGPLSGTIDPVSVGTNVFIQDLVAGIYSITVVDANGCEEMCEFEITEPICLLTVDLTSNNLSCNGGNDGSIALVINNASSPITIDWNDDTLDGLENISGLAPGFYQVRVTDAFGCFAEASVTLTEPDPIIIKTASVNPSCFGDINGELILESISGGTAPYEVSLDGDLFQFVSDLPISFPNLASGSYILTVQDANDCIFEVDVEVEAKEELTLDLGVDIVLELGDSVRLEGIANFNVDSLIWTPSAGLSQPNQLATFVQPLENITYTLTVFDEFGCSTSDMINLVVQRPSDVYIPSAFSPNADGSNDFFTVFAGTSVAQIIDFQIFDRWGNQLYQNGPIAPNDPTLGWDGSYRGEMMNTGVYVYFIEIEMVDGTTELLKGDVLLLRN